MRFLTEEQKQLLASHSLRAHLLATLWLDEGVFRMCDDVNDLTDGDLTWIGANALFGATDIRSGAPFSAEGVTLRVDGTRAYAAGISDPAYVFNAFLETNFHQRRIDLEWAFMPHDSQNITLIVPAYAGKINHATLIDDGIEINSAEPVFSTLEIQLDALAARYGRRSFRTRSHDDQLQLDPNDQFFSYVAGIRHVEDTLYWGKQTPLKNPTYMPGGGLLGAAAWALYNKMQRDQGR